MLKHICTVTALLVILNGWAAPAAIGAGERMPTPRASMGNVDGDGDVDLADAIIVLQAVVDLDDPDVAV